MRECAILETHFKFKKILEGKLVVTNGTRFSYPTFFLLMILMQNFILANNHVKAEV